MIQFNWILATGHGTPHCRYHIKLGLPTPFPPLNLANQQLARLYCRYLLLHSIALRYRSGPMVPKVGALCGRTLMLCRVKTRSMQMEV